MITVEYTISDAGHTLKLAGHAEYAETGKDIVCAGVSSIVYALVGFLVNACPTERAKLDMTGGDVWIICHTRTPEIDAAFDMAVIGLRQIEAQYENFIKIFSNFPEKVVAI